MEEEKKAIIEEQDKSELKIQNEKFSLNGNEEDKDFSIKNIKKLICPECSLTPIITLKDSLFIAECLSNHKKNSKTIDTFLTNEKSPADLQCSEHQAQNYISFCKKCQKNICMDCFEYHEDHENELIFFYKIKPKKKQYDEYNRKYKLMEHYKKIIDDLYQKMINLRKIIEELNKLITKLLDEINEINKKFQKEYFLNKAIFESYDTLKMNYNSILNIKSFNYNIDDTIQLIKTFDMSKVYELIADINFLFDFDYIKLPYVDKRTENCIIKEFNISELFKLLIDVVYNSAKSEKEIVIEKNKEDITLDESQKTKNTIITNLIFKYKEDSEKICEIKYDKNKKELVIFYIFKFEAFNCYDNNKREERRIESFLTQFLTKVFFPYLSDFIKKKFKIKNKGIIRSYIAKEDILKKAKNNIIFGKKK